MMPRLTPADLDALQTALAKATPGEWTVEMDGPDDDDSPCDVLIPEINRILHSTEWADPEDFERDVANAEAIIAAHNALPLLIAAARAKVPEVIGEKHKKGDWWWVWDKWPETWRKAKWSFAMECWVNSDGLELVGFITHALPLPPAPEGSDA